MGYEFEFDDGVYTAIAQRWSFGTPDRINADPDFCCEGDESFCEFTVADKNGRDCTEIICAKLTDREYNNIEAQLLKRLKDSDNDNY